MVDTDYLSIDTLPQGKMLHGEVLRSTIPRGTLKAILFPDFPEGYYAITGKDIPGKNHITVFDETMPLLCEENITYPGEPLAVICGPSKEKVKELCKNTFLDFETDYSILGFDKYSKNQIAAERVFSKGNPEKIFADESLKIIEGEYRTNIQQAPFSTFQGVVVSKNKDGIDVLTDTQWPFHTQRNVADVCGIQLKEVRIEIGKFNPTYDEKLILPTIYACLGALMANKTGKQVRITPSMEEIAGTGFLKPEVLVKRISAVDEKGKIAAEEIAIDINLGAYPLFTDEILSQLIVGALGPYTISNVKVKCRAIRTSMPPMNVFKGLNISSGIFSIETHVSRIAGICNIDPGEWREKHIPGKKSYLPTGGIEAGFGGKELLDRVIRMSDFKRKHGAYEVLRKNRKGGKLAKENLRGIGIAFGFIGNGMTIKRELKETYSVKVRLDADNKVTILSSANGSPSTTIWKDIASEILGIDPSSIVIKKGSTLDLPNSGPSFLSSNLSIMTALVERCCLGIKKQRFHQALPIEVKRFYRAPGNRRWDSIKLKGMPFHTLSWGAVVVEVETDPVFLRPAIRGVWMTADGGKVYNQHSAKISLESSILDTLGFFLPGNDLAKPSLTSSGFNSPEIKKIPQIVTEIIKTKRTVTGGISRLPDALLPSAMISAISQSTGIYLDTLPFVAGTLIKYLEAV